MMRRVVLGVLAVVMIWLAVRRLPSDNAAETATSHDTTVTAIDDALTRRNPAAQASRAPRRSRVARPRQAEGKDHRGAGMPKGPATVDFAALPDAGDTQTSAPMITAAGRTLFHDGRIAAGVPVVAVRMDKYGELQAAAARTVSGDDGTYELAFASSGGIKLLAKLPGYAVAESNVGLLNAEVDSPPVFEKDLILHPAESFSGRVVDAQGRPIAGAEVAVTLRSNEIAGPRVNTLYQNYSTIETTASGEFSLQDLPPWDALVYASKRGYRLAGTSVTVPARGVELVLGTEGSFLKGRVVDVDTSGGVAGSSVCLMRFHGPNTYPKMQIYEADNDGYYVAGPLQAGGYVAVSTAKGYADLNGQTVLELGDGVTSSGVDFLLHSGYRISGRVTRLDTGEPVAGADVYIRYLAEPPLGTAHVVADANGEFLVDKFLSADREIKLAAKAPGLRTYQADRHSFGTWIGVSGQSLGQPLEIKMIGEARVRGVVLDEKGNPLPKAQVEIQPPHGDTIALNGQSIVETREDGTFSLSMAAPAAGLQLKASTADFLGASNPLSLMPGDEAEVEIRLRQRAVQPGLSPPAVLPSRDPSNPMPGAVVPGAAPTQH